MIFSNEMREILAQLEYKNWNFIVGADDGNRLYLQIICDSKCNTTGNAMKWSGRKWFLSTHMTKSELVQTAFKAVLTAEEHEARELFLYNGASIFDPHYDVDALHRLRSSPEALEVRA